MIFQSLRDLRSSNPVQCDGVGRLVCWMRTVDILSERVGWGNGRKCLKWRWNGKKVWGNKNFKKEGMLDKEVIALRKGRMWPSFALCILKQCFKRRYLLLYKGVIKIDWKRFINLKSKKTEVKYIQPVNIQPAKFSHSQNKKNLRNNKKCRKIWGLIFKHVFLQLIFFPFN